MPRLFLGRAVPLIWWLMVAIIITMATIPISVVLTFIA
jgi:hypothetical protein